MINPLCTFHIIDIIRHNLVRNDRHISITKPNNSESLLHPILHMKQFKKSTPKCLSDTVTVYK